MKLVKRAFAVVLVLCIVLALSACAGKPKKPTDEDAEKYVKAVLDLMCTGDYDRSVNLADADELETAVEDTVDEAINALTAQMALIRFLIFFYLFSLPSSLSHLSCLRPYRQQLLLQPYFRFHPQLPLS